MNLAFVSGIEDQRTAWLTLGGFQRKAIKLTLRSPEPHRLRITQETPIRRRPARFATAPACSTVVNATRIFDCSAGRRGGFAAPAARSERSGRTTAEHGGNRKGVSMLPQQ